MGESNSSKKRKAICREEDEDEKAKMETFFALVTNIRDTRDRWMGLRSAGSGDSKNKTGKIITAKEQSRVWKPTFQLEDFADEQARCRNSDPSDSHSKSCDKDENAEKGIDLSLSL